MRYYIIAGEASGDLHASNLVKELKKLDAQAEFRGFGGTLMASEGVEIAKDYSEIAFMGFYEVARNIGTLLGAFKLCKQDILSYSPDVVILVDFAGFNLRMAKWIKSVNIKTFYYIAPKAWAWNKSRVKKIKAYVDKLFVILPFEKQFFGQFGIATDYIGNPLEDSISHFVANPKFIKDNQLDTRPIIAVLPGSRKQEIEHMLHFMVSIIPSFMQRFQFVIAGMSSLPQEYYETFRRHDTIRIVYDQTYDLLSHAHVALVTSGTATLETALFKVPQVVCYRTTPITYLIAKSLIKVRFISLVNIIANRAIVTELIQNQFIPHNIREELNRIIEGPARETMLRDYEQLEALIGHNNPSSTTARLMVSYLKNRNDK